MSQAVEAESNPLCHEVILWLGEYSMIFGDDCYRTFELEFSASNGIQQKQGELTEAWGVTKGDFVIQRPGPGFSQEKRVFLSTGNDHSSNATGH